MTMSHLGMIPKEIKAIPFYDSIGHFVLYGLWALLLDRALEKKNIGVQLSLAMVIMLCVATAEEFLQTFSGMRTVSLGDWGWGVAGIVAFVVISRNYWERAGAHIPHTTR